MIAGNPVTIAPKDVRLVLRYELLHLGSHILLTVGQAIHAMLEVRTVVHLQRVKPLTEGEVGAKSHSLLPDGFLYIADHVAFRACGTGIPVLWPAIGRRPHAETIVKFGRKHDVLGSRPGKQVCPLVRVEELSFEQLTEVPVRHLVSEHFPDERIVHPSVLRIPNPFGVAFLGVICGNGIRTPLNKNAEFRVGEPCGSRPFREGLPRCFIVLARGLRQSPSLSSLFLAVLGQSR